MIWIYIALAIGVVAGIWICALCCVASKETPFPPGFDPEIPHGADPREVTTVIKFETPSH